ncbi:hypothetical protein ATM97_14325 [Nocardia sp. MH4]|jgi:hypothetical protein|uniref:hypothetical protein n=1 Tax=Nocardia TaxID=1817 RepID=UPI001C4F4646|nr:MULTISPECIES: hypothetical protein [Nocardia]MBW0271777.1 hypothetical protein [Nocardia sp. MH4]
MTQRERGRTTPPDPDDNEVAGETISWPEPSPLQSWWESIMDHLDAPDDTARRGPGRFRTA